MFFWDRKFFSWRLFPLALPLSPSWSVKFTPPVALSLPSLPPSVFMVRLNVTLTSPLPLFVSGRLSSQPLYDDQLCILLPPLSKLDLSNSRPDVTLSLLLPSQLLKFTPRCDSYPSPAPPNFQNSRPDVTHTPLPPLKLFKFMPRCDSLPPPHLFKFTQRCNSLSIF